MLTESSSLQLERELELARQENARLKSRLAELRDTPHELVSLRDRVKASDRSVPYSIIVVVAFAALLGVPYSPISLEKNRFFDGDWEARIARTEEMRRQINELDRVGPRELPEHLRPRLIFHRQAIASVPREPWPRTRPKPTPPPPDYRLDLFESELQGQARKPRGTTRDRREANPRPHRVEQKVSYPAVQTPELREQLTRRGYRDIMPWANIAFAACTVNDADLARDAISFMQFWQQPAVNGLPDWLYCCYVTPDHQAAVPAVLEWVTRHCRETGTDIR